MVSKKRFWTATILAWVLFIGIDFLFHASLLKSLWEEDIPALKPLDELFVLIPAGYLSFFLLTLFTAYVFYRIFPKRPNGSESAVFSMIFAALFAVSNLLGLYSYVALPLKQLIAFNLVYFLEVFTVLIFLSRALYVKKISRTVIYTIIAFFALLITGLILQNTM
jgi:hypothetical protein